ncbi:hypothetical protein ACN3ZE_001981 [Providencia rettgeri]
MGKCFLIKVFIILVINTLFLLKYHDDGFFIFTAGIFLNVIVFFLACMLYKNSVFLHFLSRYIGASGVFLIIGAVFVSLYYKEKNNEVGVFILLLTLSDVGFLIYFFFYKYIFRNIRALKKSKIVEELKRDTKFNNLTSDLYYRRPVGTNEPQAPLNNPASGLPMANSSIDIGGNAYGSYHK